jgi:lipopolysaccharide/colanic/teichoic acid biosynthesis glycosyltransferase
MVTNAEAQGPLTLIQDPRITRFGAFLRRWSIDELLQFINVLLGDMSVIGPRAVVPYVANRFNDIEKMTLAVRPGISGLAQVSGRNTLGFYDKSLLNLYYIRNYSIFLDIKIIFRTVLAVLGNEGIDGTNEER